MQQNYLLPQTKSEEAFDKLLHQLREFYKNKPKAHKGKAFEKLVQVFFENDSEYKGQIGKVYLWSEWSGRDGQDIGIDLVAEDLEQQGKFWAIQCKFYGEDNKITKDDIYSFLVTAEKEKYSYRLMVATGPGISANIEKIMADRKYPSGFLNEEQLRSASFDWRNYHLPEIESAEEFTLRHEKEKPKQLPKKTIKPHQTDAITACIENFKTHDRGKLIMACGTGKTFASLKLMEAMVKPGELVVFFTPSISLLAQTRKEWMMETEKPINPFIICSDISVGNNEDDIKTYDLPYPTTSGEKLTQQIESKKNIMLSM
ncbi:MAG: DEAD/DEAH box helicase family protein [Alphaproteobacteria bacterium]